MRPIHFSRFIHEVEVINIRKLLEIRESDLIEEFASEFGCASSPRSSLPSGQVDAAEVVFSLESYSRY